MQRFSQSLQEFQFECIGDAETDDEISIGERESARRTTLAGTGKIRSILRVNIVLYCFYSSVFKRILSVVEHRGGGEKTTGKKCACVHLHV